MKGFFIFLIFLAFAIMAFIFGNLLRCLNVSGDNCPGLCYQKVVDCSNSTNDFCDEEKKACRAPHLNEYVKELDQYIKKLKYNF